MKANKTFPLKSILFIDVETVPQWAELKDVPVRYREHWSKKCKRLAWGLPPDQEIDDQETFLYDRKAGIFAEFAKIVCISVGFLNTSKKQSIKEIRLKSFYSDKEFDLLENFCALIDEFYPNPKKFALCGHNLREFDVPFICRRLLINGLPLPALFDISGKKPWQTPHLLDTLDMWKFGDYKHYTSLDLLTTVFGVPTPKGDLDGSMVSEVYWKDQDILRIVQYCERDVLSVIQLYLKFKQFTDLEQIPIRSQILSSIDIDEEE